MLWHYIYFNINIQVPFCGDLAFFPGQLVHTNEITALIGDNWFVDVSAKEAQEIANRRKLGKNMIWLDNYNPIIYCIEFYHHYSNVLCSI